jgi:hypothetical protein
VKPRDRVVAYVTRERGGRRELLVFDLVFVYRWEPLERGLPLWGSGDPELAALTE